MSFMVHAGKAGLRASVHVRFFLCLKGGSDVPSLIDYSHISKAQLVDDMILGHLFGEISIICSSLVLWTPHCKMNIDLGKNAVSSPSEVMCIVSFKLDDRMFIL